MELVYADGEVTEFEDNVLWRAADLLGISSRDRIDLKHKVAEQRQPGRTMSNTVEAAYVTPVSRSRLPRGDRMTKL